MSADFDCRAHPEDLYLPGDVNHIPFRAPPVCTGFWSGEDWRRYALANYNLPLLEMELLGIWRVTKRTNSRGEALYRRVD